MRAHSPTLDNTEMSRHIDSEGPPQAMDMNLTTLSRRRFSAPSSPINCPNQFDYFTPLNPSKSEKVDETSSSSQGGVFSPEAMERINALSAASQSEASPADDRNAQAQINTSQHSFVSSESSVVEFSVPSQRQMIPGSPYASQRP